MRRWFHRRGDTLVPADEASQKALHRLAEGEAVRLMMERSRSPQWHRWYFGCCREIGVNQEPPRSEWSIDYELRIAAGHCVWIKSSKLGIVPIPNRIAFDQLTAEEWETLWPSIDQAMLNEFGFDSDAFKRSGVGYELR